MEDHITSKRFNHLDKYDPFWERPDGGLAYETLCERGASSWGGAAGAGVRDRGGMPRILRVRDAPLAAARSGARAGVLCVSQRRCAN